NETQVTDRNGRVRTFTYDALNRVTTETWLAGSSAVYTANYAYDAGGNLIAAGDKNSHYVMTDDTDNKLTKTDEAGTPNTTHVILTSTSDAAGENTRISDNAGVTVNSSYDAKGGLLSRSWSGGPSARVDFEHDALEQVTGV